ncbi:MAG: hypothetical protein ACHP7N_01720 [Caulobacterales bacterium]
MIEIVNGYPCQNCTDAALAQKGINPAFPNANPQSPSYDPAVAAKADHGPAFTLSGAAATGSSTGSATNGSNTAPGAPAQPGSQLNLSA